MMGCTAVNKNNTQTSTFCIVYWTVPDTEKCLALTSTDMHSMPHQVHPVKWKQSLTSKNGEHMQHTDDIFALWGLRMSGTTASFAIAFCPSHPLKRPVNRTFQTKVRCETFRDIGILEIPEQRITKTYKRFETTKVKWTAVYDFPLT